MKKSVIRMLGGAAVLFASMGPAVAWAEDGYYYVNLGNGVCGMVSCGAYGCALIDTFPCPNEVSPD